ncbi:MAG: hypothetical protein HZB42_15905 [Sphingobacteriales bacterium]|nr:hypothetical protein [Sphingobacteriales bacterium]
MKRFTLIALTAITMITGCRKIEVDGDNNSGGGGGGTTENLILSGRINTDRTLKAGNTYKLRGIVYVVDGAKLTIEPGVIIQGEKSSRGTLVITRGTQLLANGTLDKPIVFTSDAATPAMGDWGGIVILGRAKTNSSFNGVAGVGEIEGGVNNAEGLGLYGGADDNDNSGVLKYVRIEYPGYAFLPDKELNGLTMGGVGKGTTIDYVQVSNAADDSYEWFGGSVDCKHLIAYKGLDDDWDMDNGFSGRIQFGISMRDSLIADISQSNGFEIDNDAAGSSLLPQTSAVFSNMTVIGPRAALTNVGNSNFRKGIHSRRNGAVSIFNSIIMGWPTGWNLDAGLGSPTDLNYSSGAPKAFVSNTILAGNNTPFTYTASTSAPTGWTTADLLNYFNRAGGGNNTYSNTTDVILTNAFKQDGTADWNPAAGSPALTGSDFASAKVNNSFFTVTSYRGACASGDTWWKTWTRFF